MRCWIMGTALILIPTSSSAQIAVEESYQYNWSLSFVIDATHPFPEIAMACDTPALNDLEYMGLQMRFGTSEYPYMVSFLDRMPLSIQEDLNIFLKFIENSDHVIFLGLRFQNVFTPITTRYEYYELPTFVLTREWWGGWSAYDISFALQLNVTPRSFLYNEEMDEFITSEEYIFTGSLIGEFP